MSTQRQYLNPVTNVCLCGKAPKTYCTDGKLYHVECVPCGVKTPKMINVYNAAKLFADMCEAVIMDAKHPILSLLRGNK